MIFGMAGGFTLFARASYLVAIPYEMQQDTLREQPVPLSFLKTIPALRMHEAGA
jgi:hypothetical protein